MTMDGVFVTGGTGYLGRPLLEHLVARGHRVTALVRHESAARVPKGTNVVIGNALDPDTFAAAVSPAATFVHLVGIRRPSPLKNREFHSVDLASVNASVQAATNARIRHFVYLSVARPAPILRVYQEVRQRGEALSEASGMNATFLRPWYVLGPGHRWPYALIPVYIVLSRIPGTRDGALRLGLVKQRQMVSALVHAVEHPPVGVRVMDVPTIRAAPLLDPAA